MDAFISEKDAYVEQGVPFLENVLSVVSFRVFSFKAMFCGEAPAEGGGELFPPKTTDAPSE